MPPIFNFAALGSGDSFAAGAVEPDGTTSKIISTGLTSPIQLAVVLVEDRDNGQVSWFYYKPVALTGRNAVFILSDQVAIPGTTHILTALGFANGGLDLEIRDDDFAALNAPATVGYDPLIHWAAWA